MCLLAAINNSATRTHQSYVKPNRFTTKGASTWCSLSHIDLHMLEDDIGSHVCSLEACMRVTNGIPLGCPLPLTVTTVNSVQTLKATNTNTEGNDANHELCHCTGGVTQHPNTNTKGNDDVI